MAVRGMRDAFVVIMVVAVVFSATTSAVQYTVGDGSGWILGVNYASWASGKKFHVGDSLVFKYPKGAHNVAIVDGSGYSKCTISSNSKVLTSGSDTVTLTAAGQYWYICGFPGHCGAGQKLAITVG